MNTQLGDQEPQERPDLIEKLRKSPEFLELLRRSQADERAGRYVTHEEVMRKYIEEED